MLESLLPETRDIIENVEREANLKVRIDSSEKKYLGKMLLSNYIRNDDNEITLSYNPSAKSIDYAIAHEAARFLRYSRAPPGQRYALIRNKDTRKKVYKQIEKGLRNKEPETKRTIKDFFPIFYDGLMTQLLSTPADF